MFESLIESRRAARPFWRPATFGVAFGLHLCLLAAIVLASHSKVQPESEPPVRVTFLNFAQGPGEPAPAAAPATGSGFPFASAPPSLPLPAAPVTPAPAAAQPLLRLEAQALPRMTADMLQPQMTPRAISTEPQVGAQGATADTGEGGGIPGGIPGGQPLPAGPLWAGGGVSSPVVIHRVEPDYPIMARTARVEGEVTLEAVILRDGTVGEIKVVQSLRLGCTDAAIAALRRWRFLPGERNGVPVDVYFTLTVDFILN